jgi:16S rRNA (guanine1207-N2)-methyltransferase
MSRWANDPEKAADVLIARSLEAIAPQGRLLLVNQNGILPALIEARGVAAAVWNRRAGDGRPALPWPPVAPFDMALVRLAKARDEQEMTAHAAVSVLAPGGRLVVYGGNDEGIRSAAGMLEAFAGPVETLAARGHGRVLAVTRPPDLSRVHGRLADWRRVVRLSIAGAERDWVSYPGVFATGRIDEGSALLIGALPPVTPGASVLDYGCGSGIVAAAVQILQPAATIDMIDNDSVALEAARENVPHARVVLGTRLAAAGSAAYAAIFSNPPLHQGIAEDHVQLDRLVDEASRHLAPGGLLQVVVQRRVPLQESLAKHFSKVAVVAENGRFRVWRAQ